MLRSVHPGGAAAYFRFSAVLLVAALFFISARRVSAYSVLAHEAIIDSTWDKSMQPLLLKRFPRSTPEQLKEAHGYAYGGAIIQDMGYYPHGNFLFSDLTHYVRSGDFILALLRDSKSLNDYAFALGALAHYASDNDGHPIAVNRSVPLLYPKLRRKYGDSVVYEQDKTAHVRTEFGFDVLQVARGRYAPESYHDFIGFAVAAPLLNRAFHETYGLDLADLLPDEDKALNSYRYNVSQLIPKATRIAWTLKKDDIVKEQPGITQQRFLYNLSQASYQKDWGMNYQRPGGSEKLLAFVIRIVPKIGPLKFLHLKMPSPEAEKLFEASFNKTLERYRQLLSLAGTNRLTLPNLNFDTGASSPPGGYKLSDQTHATLLEELSKQNFAGASPEMRAELLEFFGHPDAPYASRKKPKDWAKVQEQVEQLKATNLPAAN